MLSGFPGSCEPLILVPDSPSARVELVADASRVRRLLSFVSRRELRKTYVNDIDRSLHTQIINGSDELVFRRVLECIEREDDTDGFVQIRDAGATGAGVEGEEAHEERLND